jgi:hypothetical protein
LNKLGVAYVQLMIAQQTPALKRLVNLASLRRVVLWAREEGLAEFSPEGARFSARHPALAYCSRSPAPTSALTARPDAALFALKGEITCGEGHCLDRRGAEA